MPQINRRNSRQSWPIVLWIDDDPGVFTLARRLASRYSFEPIVLRSTKELNSRAFLQYVAGRRFPILICVGQHRAPEVGELRRVFQELPITAVISDLQIGGDPSSGIAILSLASTSPSKPEMILYSGKISDSTKRIGLALGINHVILKSERPNRLESLLAGWLAGDTGKADAQRSQLSRELERFKRENIQLRKQRTQLRKRLRTLMESPKTESQKAIAALSVDIAKLREEKCILEKEMQMILAHHHDLTNTSSFTLQALDHVCGDPNLLPPIILEELERARISAKHCSVLVSTLTTLTMKPNKAKIEPSSLERVLSQALQILRGRIPPSISVHVDVPSRLPLCGIPEHLLVRCVLNLLLNSLEAMPDKGRVTILATNPRGRVGFIHLVIRDNGKGIKKRDLPRVSNPDFSTKGKSQGLGLYFVRLVMENFKGIIAISSERRKGTQVSLKIPIA